MQRQPTAAASLVALLLILPVHSLSSEDESLRVRVAVAPFASAATESALAGAGETVAETISLNLGLLGHYRVEKPTGIAAVKDLASARIFAGENRLDAVVLGFVSRRDDGSIALSLRFYDRRADAFTVERSISVDSVLDLFDASDTLTKDFLNALSGRHLGFGSIRIKRNGEGGDYHVSLDGGDIGQNLADIPSILNGDHEIAITQHRLLGEVEVLKKRVTVLEDQTVDLDFSIPYLTEEESARIDPDLATVRAGLGHPGIPGFDRARDELLALIPPTTPWSPRVATIRAEVATIAEKVADERDRLSKGRLIVESDPPGALFAVDGSDMTQTPADLEVGAGPHSVEFFVANLDGYRMADEPRREVEVPAAGEYRLSVALTKLKGSLSVEGAPAGYTVYARDVAVGVTPLSDAAVDAGDVPLRFVKDGVADYATDIQVAVGLPTILTWGSAATIAVVLPRATIVLDGKPDSWKDIGALWVAKSPKSRDGDASFGMTRLFLCRDDNFLYWRADFAGRNPIVHRPASTRQQVNFEVFLFYAEHQWISIQRDNNVGLLGTAVFDSILNTWDDQTKKAVVLKDTIIWRQTTDMIEGSVPLTSISRYLAMTNRLSASVAYDRDWGNADSTPDIYVDFSR